MPTFFVPLLKVHIDSSTSTLSPKEYGKGGPLAMADATADFRKSMTKHDKGSPPWSKQVDV